ncbi:MAG: hypothetical protein KF776_17455 [Burkholderiales bacterium]|nr:hypothetical protein [Burkholderiales bacterium]
MNSREDEVLALRKQVLVARAGLLRLRIRRDAGELREGVAFARLAWVAGRGIAVARLALRALRAFRRP